MLTEDEMGGASTAAWDGSARDFADELSAFLRELDPSTWPTMGVDAARRALDELRVQAHALLARFDAGADSTDVHKAVQDVSAALLKLDEAGDSSEWPGLRDAIEFHYSAMVEALAADDAADGEARPANLRRSVTHAAMGTMVAAAYTAFPDQTTWIYIAVGWNAFVWGCEILRRRSDTFQQWLMWSVRGISREREWTRVASSTWFATAMLAIVVMAPNHAGVLGVLALGLGDPVAGIIGRRFGRTPLYMRKSLEGALAFVAVMAVVGIGYMAMLHPELSAWRVVIVGLTAAVAGSATEVLSTRIDDNFTIPVVTAWSVMLIEQLCWS